MYKKFKKDFKECTILLLVLLALITLVFTAAEIAAKMTHEAIAIAASYLFLKAFWIANKDELV